MESFGIVLIEAMACKTPVVATDVGGIPEIVEHEITGILAEPQNPRALAAAMRRVLTDTALRTTMAENGYSKVMHRFCASHNGAAYISAFNSLLAQQCTSQSQSTVPAESSRGANASL
jgi:glycosyltransferase involved in cell wall biosynthesis